MEKEGGREAGGGGGGGVRWSGEEGHRGGPTRSSGEPGPGSCCFLPVALGQLSNQVTSPSRVASAQLFCCLCVSPPSVSSQRRSPQLPPPPPPPPLMSLFSLETECRPGEGSLERLVSCKKKKSPRDNLD